MAWSEAEGAQWHVSSVVCLVSIVALPVRVLPYDHSSLGPNSALEKEPPSPLAPREKVPPIAPCAMLLMPDPDRMVAGMACMLELKMPPSEDLMIPPCIEELITPPCIPCMPEPSPGRCPAINR